MRIHPIRQARAYASALTPSFKAVEVESVQMRVDSSQEGFGIGMECAVREVGGRPFTGVGVNINHRERFGLRFFALLSARRQPMAQACKSHQQSSEVNTAAHSTQPTTECDWQSSTSPRIVDVPHIDDSASEHSLVR